jgi:hypothetical protein
MASIVERLTENIVERNLLREGAALSKKWEKTGLLEGIDNTVTKTTMSRLLENQAKELLREASTMSAGDVEGFAAVAFPIVRRVFGGLIANELVAVQPMSLPSGLIFFLDFKYTDSKGFSGAVAGESIYGGGVVASQITGGVSLTGSNLEKSFFSLNNGYSSATGSNTSTITIKEATYFNSTGETTTQLDGQKKGSELTDLAALQLIKYDPDILADTTNYYAAVTASVSAFTALSEKNLVALNVTAISGATLTAKTVSSVRRLTEYLPTDRSKLVLVLKSSAAIDVANGGTDPVISVAGATWAVNDQLGVGNGLGSVLADLLPLEGAGANNSSTSGLSYTPTNSSTAGQNLSIPEIDIKVDSIGVTAEMKKLKAKWSPELGQDLNAYHNLDAEVELTSILSEHVALEIDQEILNDLVKGATAAVKYWSRRPGKFVNRDTGASITSVGAPPDFTGAVSQWYETLVETINDVSAQIHRKTLRGGANFLVTSPEVANILEFTSGFRADLSMEDLKGGSVGAVKTGSISKKWDVYIDPYFYRNLILVGRKGKSFLESGFVYAPYVPLMITPTIFGTEDFVPRKGLMTRYAKKMVRPDYFGLVVIQDLIG